jgi:DNA-binding MarR family transcriptional regulator
MVRDPYEPSLAVLLDEVKAELVARMRERLRAAGHPELRDAHGHVFRRLHGGPARLTDMAEAAGMSKQAFGEHVAALERLGYVERVPDPQDGRAKLVVPTARGEEAIAAARRAFAEIEDEWGAAIGRPRMRELRAALAQIRLAAHLRGTNPAEPSSSGL